MNSLDPVVRPASLLLRARTRFAQTARAGVGGTPAALLLLLFSFAAILLLFFFDPATSSFYPPCLFSTLLGMQCPGCGSLRAAHQLLHGNLREAWALNPALIIVGPLAAAISLFTFLRNSSPRA